jgi:hypothetical protein
VLPVAWNGAAPWAQGVGAEPQGTGPGASNGGRADAVIAGPQGGSDNMDASSGGPTPAAPDHAPAAALVPVAVVRKAAGGMFGKATQKKGSAFTRAVAPASGPPAALLDVSARVAQVNAGFVLPFVAAPDDPAEPVPTEDASGRDAPSQGPPAGAASGVAVTGADVRSAVTALVAGNNRFAVLDGDAGAVPQAQGTTYHMLLISRHALGFNL